MSFQTWMPYSFVADSDLSPPAPSPMVRWENDSTLTRQRDTYSFIDPWRFKNQLKGRVALVTLAHRGIGKATAIAFAQAGAAVCCIGPNAESLEPVLRQIKEKYGTPTLALTANLLESGAPTSVVALTEQHLGPVDFLINVTGGSYLRPFMQEPDTITDWWPSIERNVRIPAALTHAVLPSMIARKTGIIISTASQPGVVQVPFASGVGIAHTALLKFHHQLDLEMRSKGIYSYAVNPGPIPSHIHDPDMTVSPIPSGFSQEPAFQMELANKAKEMEWASVGLASGTFVTLCADPRARILSGLYVNAERDLGEMINEVEHDRLRVEQEKLYILKVDEF